MVLRFSTRHFSAASLVMKLMNSETHSWTHSLASLEILAVAGTLDFIILATFAIFRQTRQSQARVKGEGRSGGARGMSGCAHGEETVLFPILPDFLLRYRRRIWGILSGRLWRDAGTISEGGDGRCVLRHNSLDETFGLTRSLPHPSGAPPTTAQSLPYLLPRGLH